MKEIQFKVRITNLVVPSIVPNIFEYWNSQSLHLRIITKKNSGVLKFNVQVYNTLYSARISMKCGFQTTDGAAEQFVLSSVKLARVINWKSVYMVLCYYVSYVEIYTERTPFVNSINFCFHLKKSAAESY